MRFPISQSRLFLAWSIACWIVCSAGSSFGQAVGQSSESSPMPQQGVSADSLSLSETQARSSVQWLASVALNKLPRSVDGDKDWGDTKKVWAGVNIKRDGWKLRTHRRFREVEHGRWVRYAVNFPEPGGAGAPAVVIQRVLPVRDETTDQQRWQIESSMVVPMKFTARIQRWNLGVRIFSVTVTGEMRIQLSSVATMGFFADYAEVPPALVIDPKVEQAHLSLERFEVERVSHIGGDVAEQWGEVMQEILVERFVRKQNDNLVAKLNRSIEKERDDLRFSLADWLQLW